MFAASHWIPAVNCIAVVSEVSYLVFWPPQQAAQHAFSDLSLNGLSICHALYKKGASMTDIALSHDEVVDVSLCLDPSSHILCHQHRSWHKQAYKLSIPCSSLFTPSQAW